MRGTHVGAWQKRGSCLLWNVEPGYPYKLWVKRTRGITEAKYRNISGRTCLFWGESRNAIFDGAKCDFRWRERWDSALEFRGPARIFVPSQYCTYALATIKYVCFHALGEAEANLVSCLRVIRSLLLTFTASVTIDEIPRSTPHTPTAYQLLYTASRLETLSRKPQRGSITPMSVTGIFFANLICVQQLSQLPTLPRECSQEGPRL